MVVEIWFESCPRYLVKRPRENSPGAVVLPDGNVFGNISFAHHLTAVFVAWIPLVAEQERGRLLGGVSVIGSEDIGIGLPEGAHVGVPDSLAEDLRTHPGFQRAGRVGV